LRERARSDRGRSRVDLIALVTLLLFLIAWFLGPFVVRGYAFPVGPDAPVYLWWTRLAGHDGLSAVPRPGGPAVALVVQGTLHIPLTAVLAALECVLGIGVGLAAAALARTRAAGPSLRGEVRGWERRASWVLVGALAGTFAVHLAAGYLANLAFADLYVAAATALAIATRRATVGAGLLLGAAGLAHPLFLLVGLAVLAIAGAMGWRHDRAGASRIAGAGAGGLALLAAGWLSLQAGPAPPSAVTSRDGFLKEAGLTDTLRTAYWYRFLHRWTRYVEWASVPLAVYGVRWTDGFVRRFLVAWGAVTVAGVALGLASGLFPADRFIAFGFAVPILSAFGLIGLWRALAARKVLAASLVGVLTVAMLSGALIAWARQKPFLSMTEVADVTEAGRYAAAAPPGTPLLFSVNASDRTASFLAARAANVIRAVVPPDRIRDVHVVVPGSGAGSAESAERVGLSRVTTAEAERATRAARGRAMTFLLTPFDAVDAPPPSATRASGDVFVAMAGAGTVPAPSRHALDSLQPSSPGGIALSTIAVLLLTGAAGYGWARTFVDDVASGVALGPSCGTAALILTGIVLERLGVPLTGSIGPTVVSAAAGGSGYLALFLLQRNARSQAPDQVHQEPR
jgi:hypothetical protein